MLQQGIGRPTKYPRVTERKYERDVETTNRYSPGLLRGLQMRFQGGLPILNPATIEQRSKYYRRRAYGGDRTKDEENALEGAGEATANGGEDKGDRR